MLGLFISHFHHPSRANNCYRSNSRMLPEELLISLPLYPHASLSDSPIINQIQHLRWNMMENSSPVIEMWQWQLSITIIRRQSQWMLHFPLTHFLICNIISLFGILLERGPSEIDSLFSKWPLIEFMSDVMVTLWLWMCQEIINEEMLYIAVLEVNLLQVLHLS